MNNGGAQIDGPSSALSPSAISSDGRYVAFAVDTPVSIDGSNAGTLDDVFVRDRVAGTTSLISKSTAGVAGSSSSDMAAISPSGRYVVFRSFSTQPGDEPVRKPDLRARPPGGHHHRHAPATGREQLRGPARFPISAHRFPVQHGRRQRSRHSSTSPRAAACSTSSALHRPLSSGNGTSGNYTGISADGVVMVFDSAASDLVADDTNSASDVFVVVPEPDAAAGWLVAAAALAVAARRRGNRRSR